MQTLLTLAAVALALANGLPTADYEPMPLTPHGRIVGGKDARIEDVPYQVLLEAKGNGFCGGSIIGTRWVITAGHCIVYPDELVRVRAGSTSRGRGGTLHKVIESIRHEDYKVNEHGVPSNDIALLKVDKPFALDEKRQPIVLFAENEVVSPGDIGIITGWGTLTPGGPIPNTLQMVSIPLIDRENCSQAYASLGGIPSGQICAAHPAGGKDACQGDSGGPLAVAGRLAGVVSWGNGCAMKNYPGAYTEVAKYRQWIEEKTGL